MCVYSTIYLGTPNSVLWNPTVLRNYTNIYVQDVHEICLTFQSTQHRNHDMEMKEQNRTGYTTLSTVVRTTALCTSCDVVMSAHSMPCDHMSWGLIGSAVFVADEYEGSVETLKYAITTSLKPETLRV